MKSIKYLLLLFKLVIASFICNAQSKKLEASKIIGIWTIKNHVSKTQDTTLELSFQDKARFYTFNKNGTYSLKYYGEGSSYGTTGKWKLSQDLNNIELYNIKMSYAAPPNSSTKNQKLDIINYSDTSFIIKELLDSDIKPGLSIYKKLK
ncbi:MAG: DUF5004 domain-containing protein [Ferruginibacter sp.]